MKIKSVDTKLNNKFVIFILSFCWKRQTTRALSLHCKKNSSVKNLIWHFVSKSIEEQNSSVSDFKRKFFASHVQSHGMCYGVDRKFDLKFLGVLHSSFHIYSDKGILKQIWIIYAYIYWLVLTIVL